MSIFGSRNKTTVGTQAQRVIEDKAMPDAIRSGAIAALAQNSSDTTAYIMEELVTGLATQVQRYFKYGQEHYVHGLPVGRSYSSVTGKDVVEQAMEADVGAVDSIDYYKLGAVNLLHYGWSKLVDDYGYDSTSNKLILDGAEYYLVDMYAVVVESTVAELENGSMDRWGVLPNAGHTPAKASQLITNQFAALKSTPEFLVDAAAATDYVKVSYCREIDETVQVEGVPVTQKKIENGSFNIPVEGLSMSANYFQVRYLRAGKAGYWTYQLNSGLKPAVEAIFDSAPTEAGTYYPWGYFRFNKKSALSEKGSPAFDSSERLLGKLSMDLEEVTTAMHENPDIADVEQAMLMFAVPANGESEVERRYLFDYFSRLYISAAANGGAGTSVGAQRVSQRFGNNTLNGTSIVIQDKRFKMALSFTGIYKRRIAGSIGKVGAHDSGLTNNFEAIKYMDVAGSESFWNPAVPVHYFRRQVTENLYEEISVTGLKMVYWIWGDYTTTADENDDILLVPLDHSIVEEYTMLEREKLYGYSMHYIFNSRVVTRLKWYQTGIFKAFMIIVAVVIMVYNIKAGMAAMKAAVAAGATLSALAYTVLVAVVKYIVVTLAVRLFIKVVGVRFAFIVAILAAVVGMYQIIDAGGVAGAPWANELLMVSSGLSKGISTSLSSDFDALRADAEAFQKEMGTKVELLEKAEDLLDGNINLVPLVIFGESPDDLYQRTVHSGNIGVVGIEAVSSFVDMKLQLPKLSDFQGDFV